MKAGRCTWVCWGASYNSVPAAGNKKNDLGLFTGINVKFGAP